VVSTLKCTFSVYGLSSFSLTSELQRSQTIWPSRSAPAAVPRQYLPVDLDSGQGNSHAVGDLYQLYLAKGGRSSKSQTSISKLHVDVCPQFCAGRPAANGRVSPLTSMAISLRCGVSKNIMRVQ
jgi:hypothetical protein